MKTAQGRMKTARAILKSARQAGLNLRLEGGELVVAKKGSLNRHLVKEIGEHTVELRALLGKAPELPMEGPAPATRPSTQQAPLAETPDSPEKAPLLAAEALFGATPSSVTSSAFSAAEEGGEQREGGAPKVEAQGPAVAPDLPTREELEGMKIWWWACHPSLPTIEISTEKWGTVYLVSGRGEHRFLVGQGERCLTPFQVWEVIPEEQRTSDAPLLGEVIKGLGGEIVRVSPGYAAIALEKREKASGQDRIRAPQRGKERAGHPRGRVEALMPLLEAENGQEGPDDLPQGGMEEEERERPSSMPPEEGEERPQGGLEPIRKEDPPRLGIAEGEAMAPGIREEESCRCEWYQPLSIDDRGCRRSLYERCPYQSRARSSEERQEIEDRKADIRSSLALAWEAGLRGEALAASLEGLAVVEAKSNAEELSEQREVA